MAGSRFLLLALCLLLAVPAGSSPGQATAVALLRFNEWFAAQGGKWSPSVSATADLPTCGGFGGADDDMARGSEALPPRGNIRVISRGRIPRETVLVATPHHLLLTPAPLSACPSCTPHERLALRLLEEVAKGDGSRWSPYLSLLPHTLMPHVGKGSAFTAEDLAELQGTYAGGMLASARAAVLRFAAKAKLLLRGRFSDETLRWAMAVVLSRSFTVGRPLSSSSGGGGGEDVQSLYDMPFLAPGADFLNHSPTARVGWTLSAQDGVGLLHKGGGGMGGGSSTTATSTTTSLSSSSSSSLSSAPSRSPLAPGSRMFAIVALEPLAKAGMEVFSNYHDEAPNGYLLAHHGFVVLPALARGPAAAGSGGGSKGVGAAVAAGGGDVGGGGNPYDGIALTFPSPPSFGGALERVRRDLIEYVRNQADKGASAADERDVDLVASLLRIDDGVSEGGEAPNATIFLRNTLLPESLLNLARLSALAIPAAVPWLDSYANAHGGAVYVDTARFLVGGSGIAVPSSAADELERVGKTLRGQVEQWAARRLAGAVGIHRAAQLLPPSMKTSASFAGFARIPGGEEELASVGVDGELEGSAASLLLPVPFPTLALLERTALNTSVLTDLFAMRLLGKALTSIVRRYPSTLEEDEAALISTQRDISRIERECAGRGRGEGGGGKGGATAAVGPATAANVAAEKEATPSGKRGAAAVAAAYSAATAGRERALGDGAGRDDESEGQGQGEEGVGTGSVEAKAKRAALLNDLARLQRKRAILACRVGEMRVLSGALARLDALVERLEGALRSHNVVPLSSSPAAAGAGGAKGARRVEAGKEDWTADLPLPAGDSREPLSSRSGARAPFPIDMARGGAATGLPEGGEGEGNEGAQGGQQGRSARGTGLRAGGGGGGGGGGVHASHRRAHEHVDGSWDVVE